MTKLTWRKDAWFDVVWMLLALFMSLFHGDLSHMLFVFLPSTCYRGNDKLLLQLLSLVSNGFPFIIVDIHGRLAIVNPQFTIWNSFKKLVIYSLANCQVVENMSFTLAQNSSHYFGQFMKILYFCKH